MLQKARATMREMQIPPVGPAVDATMPIFNSAEIMVPRKASPPPLLHAANTNVMPAAPAERFAPQPNRHRFHNYAPPPPPMPTQSTLRVPPPSSIPSLQSSAAHLTTFADLSHGWDGMFHETPAPQAQYTAGLSPHVVPSMGGQMLDDRWLYFMNHYDILSDPRMPPS